MERAIEHLRSDDILLYASDYPHWQFDGDAVMPAGFSPALRRKIAIDNPLATYARLKEDARRVTTSSATVSTLPPGSKASPEPGGICISNDAYRQVSGKLDVAFEDGGEQELKNIARPVKVYWIQID